MDSPKSEYVGTTYSREIENTPSSVSYHSTRWMREATWLRINDAVRYRAGALDRQTAPTGGEGTNYGPQAPRPVDTLDLLGAVLVAVASASAAPGAVGRSAGCPGSTDLAPS